MISTPYGSFFYGRFVNKRNAEKRKTPAEPGYYNSGIRIT